MSSDVAPFGSKKSDIMILATCFLRTYLVGAAFNTRGMQNVGLIYAMEPGLRRIYPDPLERANARKRYIKHYNTHLFWTPLLLGVFLSLEDSISHGVFTKQFFDSVKDTTVYTLSALGDSFFAGSLLVFWSLSTITMLLAGYSGLALGWSVFWFVLLQCFKVISFILGFREGLKFLLRLKKVKLIDWGQRLKLVNAVLLACVLYFAWPEQTHGVYWLASIGSLMLAGWMIVRLRVAREILVCLLLAAYAAWPSLHEIFQDYF